VNSHRALVVLLFCPLAAGFSQTGENVLVVVNQSSPVSRRIGEYYIHKRDVPLENLCTIKTTTDEEISYDVYESQIESPVARYLRSHRLAEKILYIVTTSGVPLKIHGPGEGMSTESSSVDSELTLLYGKLRGARFRRPGLVPNPFFERTREPFRHPQFPIYLVTRLAGYDFADVKAMIDRSLVARNRGKFVIDLREGATDGGDAWLREAALALPRGRVVFDDGAKVLYHERDVIGYASWGSNDKNRKERRLGFEWLPGAIATEFVSTDGRTFARPPDTWNISTWKNEDKPRWFAGAPQTLTADYIHEGASGCSGHVYEPYLSATPRPQILLPAYYHGRNLAESYYLAIPGLSWQNIVVGDPLCKIGTPE